MAAFSVGFSPLTYVVCTEVEVVAWLAVRERKGEKEIVAKKEQHQKDSVELNLMKTGIKAFGLRLFSTGSFVPTPFFSFLLASIR